MTTRAEYTAPLRELIEDSPPASVAAIGTLASAALDAEAKSLEHAQRHDLAWSDAATRLAELGLQEIAVASIESGTEPATAEPVLAALRDIYARKILLLVAEDSAWRNADIVGLGFTRLGSFPGSAGRIHVYGFDIATYKTTPEWLNPRYWAHPELWGKYRW